VGAVKEVLDVHTLSHTTERHALQMNDIGRVTLTLQTAIVCDAYLVQPAMGAFVLIDEVTHHTIAAGMIREFSH
jgi:sulfate adenylyltransferase subunit 1